MTQKKRIDESECYLVIRTYRRVVPAVTDRFYRLDCQGRLAKPSYSGLLILSVVRHFGVEFWLFYYFIFLLRRLPSATAVFQPLPLPVSGHQLRSCRYRSPVAGNRAAAGLILSSRAGIVHDSRRGNPPVAPVAGSRAATEHDSCSRSLPGAT